MDKEQQVWKHYEDYLKEANIGIPYSDLSHILSGMRNNVSGGCTRAELKEMMLNIYTPVNIMWALEQWQIQMDILLHTKLDSLSGKSRYEYYDRELDENPYVFDPDDVLDDSAPDTHIYDLSSITQDMISIASEFGRKESTELLLDIQKKSHLKKNWELQMLIGDCYRQNKEFDKAISTYEELWKQNGHNDLSIPDAISFTRFAKQQGDELFKRKMDDWLDEYHEFKKSDTFRRESPKVSRNDPCPCGSGKKYKNCCGRNPGKRDIK